MRFFFFEHGVNPNNPVSVLIDQNPVLGSEFCRYNIQKNKWEILKWDRRIGHRFGHSLVFYGNSLWLYGGTDYGNSHMVEKKCF